MHIDPDALTSAVAITSGMFAVGMPITWAQQYDLGAVELYSEIGRYAALSCQLGNEAAACPDFANGGFPGVYAYEVEEPFGHELAELVRRGLGDPTENGAGEAPLKATLGRLALEFFDKAERPIPFTEAIIERLTGYKRGGCLLYTIRLGAGANVPVHHGGTKPDEPTWYFSDPDEADKAVDLAGGPMALAFTTDIVAALPNGERISSFDAFREYAETQ